MEMPYDLIFSQPVFSHFILLCGQTTFQKCAKSTTNHAILECNPAILFHMRRVSFHGKLHSIHILKLKERPTTQHQHKICLVVFLISVYVCNGFMYMKTYMFMHFWSPKFAKNVLFCTDAHHMKRIMVQFDLSHNCSYHLHNRSHCYTCLAHFCLLASCFKISPGSLLSCYALLYLDLIILLVSLYI